MAALAPSTAPDEAATSSLRRASRAATPDRQKLDALRVAMNLAQRTVLAERRHPADQPQLRIARVAQLLAMSRYEEALTSCCLPIPPRLRRETQLLRRLLA